MKNAPLTFMYLGRAVRLCANACCVHLRCAAVTARRRGRLIAINPSCPSTTLSWFGRSLETARYRPFAGCCGWADD
eukprot:3614572-Amphidinium_carterae.1